MKQLTTIMLIALLAATHIANAQVKPASGQSTIQITVDHLNRSFIVYLPKSYSTAQKTPVIFLFHGGGANAGSMLNISDKNDFTAISERENIILVALQGIDKSWNDGRQTKANKQNIDDIKFVAKVLQYMELNYAVDTTRIYATGISNGGFMVSRIGCEMGNRFAAIAAVAATMGSDTPYATCSPTFTLPVMYIHGTEDPLVHFNGGAKTIGAEGAYVSHQKVLEKWIIINKCNPRPEVTSLPDIAIDGTSISKEVYAAGKSGAEVIGYTVNNGGHTWPGGKQYLPKIMIGRLSRDMNACEVIWDFFKLHHR
ncbi:hypothetical protein A3860_32450 [Niastella vici]|uniref:Peptidase S9 prolyl oligopeptidase catalytic domain-containing protein n=1 Tax=Niastella vici TaxID=1703345 RepID=A0A1V9FQZ8_9BACT|nr:prolyl oligopeptidase family serine peptidase [Niastella vici]OQP60711.1 hypothetical protein A3860_32450 [Niastella vici]